MTMWPSNLKRATRHDNGASDGSEKCLLKISRDGYTWPRLTQNYVTTWEDEGMVDYGTTAPDSVQC